MSTRAAFIDYVRARRTSLFRPGVPDDVLALAGLDDAALERWAASPRVLVTLPHASPNVFDPRTRVGWYAGRLQARDPGVHHVRAVLTHVNFSDLGWRPYGWWYLDGDHQVCCARQFTRNKKRKHVVVSSRPPLEGVPEGMTGTDADAARAAAWGADLALSYLLVGAVTERAAGMVSGGAATYLPLTLFVGFARERAAAGGADPLTRWCRALLADAGGRRLDASGELEDCDPFKAEVLDNDSDLTLLALTGSPVVAGGAKMAGYWPQIDALAARLSPDAPADCPPPRLLVVPDADLLAAAGPSPDVAAQLAAQGVPYSQGLAVAEHGAFAARSDPFHG